MRARACLVATIAACATASPSAKPRAPMVMERSGTIDLGNGNTVRWGLAFDMNAIVTLVSTRAGLVALLASGHLARFDPTTLRLEDLHVGPESVTALGTADDGSLVVGMDGRKRHGVVATLDPRTWRMSVITSESLAGHPIWVGSHDGIAYAAGQEDIGAGPEHDPYTLARLERGGERFGPTLPGKPTTGFLDSTGRVWLGADKGEFGGWISVYDPATDHLSAIELAHEDLPQIDGFVEHQGTVYAYGGMGMGGRALVLRVAPGPVVAAFDHQSGSGSSVPGPDMPITHMVSLPDGGLAVATYRTSWRPGSDGSTEVSTSAILGRCDAKFAHWTPLANDDLTALSLFYPPEASSLALLPDGAIAAALPGVGILRVPTSGPPTRSERVGGQLAAHHVELILPWKGGILFVDPYSHEAWQSVPGGWSRLAVEQIGATPWLAYVERVTSPGWASVPLHRRLLRNLLHQVGTGGPPWLLVEKKTGLWRVDPDASAVKAVVVWDDLGALDVSDAVVRPDGKLLLATDRGLRISELSGGETRDASIAVDRSVRRVTYDATGRLWMGGDGIWVEARPHEIVSLGDVPGVGTRAVTALAPDPAQPTGVAAAFEKSVAYLALVPRGQ